MISMVTKTRRKAPITVVQDRDTKQCIVCRLTLPFRLFAATGRYSERLGRKYGDNTCRECRETQRRQRGVRRRHERYDSRGRCWCSHCQQFLTLDHFKSHPSRPGSHWAYCRECTRIKDRERYAKKTSTPQGKAAVLAGRLARKRRQQSLTFRERREYLSSAILALRKRGLTKAEIGRLTGITLNTISKYERRAVSKPTANSVERIALLFAVTLDWPKHEHPAGGRRLPHPHYAELERYMQPRIVQFPIRNAWKNGRRAA